MGEDVQEGQIVVRRGIQTWPADIGGCMALGITQLRVAIRPKIGILSCGDEVIPPWQEPLPGQVRNVNLYSLAALVTEAGGEPVLYGIVKDQLELMKDSAAKAMSECQAVVITAGSSASARDMTAEAGHRRRAAHHGAAGAIEGRRHRFDAAGPGTDRRVARHRHVPPGQRASARHRREHELFPVPALRRPDRTFSAMAARAPRPSGSMCRSSARCRSTWKFAKIGFGPAGGRHPSGRPVCADLSRHCGPRARRPRRRKPPGAENRDRGVAFPAQVALPMSNKTGGRSHA